MGSIIIGVSLGIFLELKGIVSILNLVSLSNIFFISLVWLIRYEYDTKANKKVISFNQYKTTVFSPIFGLIFICTVIFMFITEQVSTSLMIHLSNSKIRDIQWLLSNIVMLNSLVVILLHVPIATFVSKLSLTNRISIGFIILIMAQIAYFLCRDDEVKDWMIATIFLSIAEIIVFPSLSILVDKLAPKNKKGQYFATFSLTSLGWVFAPIIGAFIITEYNFQILCIACIVLAIFPLVIFRLKVIGSPKNKRVKTKTAA